MPTLPLHPDPTLINEDIRPAGPSERRWSVTNMAALWVGMVVCVPTYMLAGGLIAQGMSWKEAIFTVMLGNVIVLVPMVLNGHPGTKYGIPFPVLARSSFGINGAHIPSLLRALVACGWFGIQTWVGGSSIYQLGNLLFDGALAGAALPLLGINLAQFVCFMIFWAIQVVIINKGVDTIRVLETWAAPFLIVMGLLLLGWAYFKADGFGAMMAKPSAFAAGGAREGQFSSVFFPSLTAMVGFWATLSLNIPDFTRYAKSQRDQVLGQAIGLPATMTLFAFIGVAVTSATPVIFGETIWDPTVLLGRIGEVSSGVGGVIAVLVSLFALSIATLSTNIAANVVSPANAIINIRPDRISFQLGGYITAGLGLVMMPWKLLASTGSYIFTWLIGYSALLGPIGANLIVDYFLVRRMELDLEDLFRRDGRYAGVNWVAVVSLIVAVLPNLPGFLHVAGILHPHDASCRLHNAAVVDDIPAIFDALYTYAWFVGFAISGVLYYVGMKLKMAWAGQGPTPSAGA